MIHYSPLIINDQFLTQSLSLSDSVSVTYLLVTQSQTEQSHSLTDPGVTHRLSLTHTVTHSDTHSQSATLTYTDYRVKSLINDTHTVMSNTNSQ